MAKFEGLRKKMELVCKCRCVVVITAETLQRKLYNYVYFLMWVRNDWKCYSNISLLKEEPVLKPECFCTLHI